tara:strand:- start:652 stop:1047 length:396 start_codon:yes stop_codon:yes gene_type:complete
MKDGQDTVRIDRWLWAIRIFKTRVDSTQACKGSKVRVNDLPIKPSSKIKIGDLVQIKKHGINCIMLVSGLIEKRVGSSRVHEFCTDKTPTSELIKAKERRENSKLQNKHQGKGRPTKKDRRSLKRFVDYEF